MTHLQKLSACVEKSKAFSKDEINADLKKMKEGTDLLVALVANKSLKENSVTALVQDADNGFFDLVAEMHMNEEFASTGFALWLKQKLDLFTEDWKDNDVYRNPDLTLVYERCNLVLRLIFSYIEATTDLKKLIDADDYDEQSIAEFLSQISEFWKDEEDNHEEKDDDEEEEDEEEEEEEQDVYDENVFEDYPGSIEVDEENNMLRFVNEPPREFIEQDTSQPPFLKIGGLTLPALKEEDLPTEHNLVDPCSICLQRNCNTVILPCGDKEFCLCCIYENFTLRNQNFTPLICPTCCGPITNVMRTKTKK